jgi:hypothetical protein
VRANPAELPLNRRAKGRQAESEDAIRGGGREAADGAARYGAGGNWDDTREHDCKTTVSFLPPTGGGSSVSIAADEISKGARTSIASLHSSSGPMSETLILILSKIPLISLSQSLAY